MAQVPYIFNQLHALLPRDYFEYLVKKHKGNIHLKDYSCWNHLLVMIWAQLTARRSLRDIEASLRAHSDKLYRMGIGHNVSRNNIAYANAKRDVTIFRELAQVMMQRTSTMTFKDETLQIIGKTFRLNGFFAVDSTSVTLDLSRFRWSVPQEECGGIKLHTMYDLMRGVPRMCLITGHEERDQTFMEDCPYERECVYVFDKMYFKTKGLSAINADGAYFIIRLKRNVAFEVVEREIVDDKSVLTDETIRFTSRWARTGYSGKLRRIRYYSPEKNEILEFLTNNFEINAASIALLYRYRWQIELFFKWIKQHLRITSFYGTSANAVMIQIYVAFTSFCMLALAADAMAYKGSLYEFANIMSVSLTERIYLEDLLDRYNRTCNRPPEGTQLSLFNF